MYIAQGAAIRTACLSRQVGACLVDRNGNVISTGTNEVPRAGGGVYGSGFSDEPDDGRCAYRRDENLRVCSNTREQNRIVEQVISTLPGLLLLVGTQTNAGEALLECLKSMLQTDGDDRYALAMKATENFQQLKNLITDKLIDNKEAMNSLKESLAGIEDRDKQKIVRTLRKDAGIGELLEFTRAVHAEMEALLAAARKGISTIGSRMFVTTYPCHLCAPQIVCAGVDEVQYIEPYPKSRAYELHKDAIVQDAQDWIPPSQIVNSEGRRAVLFHPFVGVAPRLYARAFLKERDLKDKHSGTLLQKFGEPEWGSPWHLGKLSYVQLEAELSKS
jgi:deoxycytidylate deaminase